jgi:tetratricopeptide (TPR) repeat protein
MTAKSLTQASIYFSIVLLADIFSCSANAEDWIDCRSRRAEVALVGCTNLIAREDYGKLAKWEVYQTRGIAFGKSSNFNRAILDFDLSINNAVLPNAEVEKSKQAELFDQRGIYKSEVSLNTDALIDFDKAVNLDSTNLEILFDRGKHYYRMGKLKNAEEDFVAITSASPAWGAGVYDMLGNVKDDQNDFASALKYYKAAISLNPLGEAAYYDLGLAYEKRNQKDDAMSYFKQALTLNPNYERAKKALARVTSK